MTNRIIGVVLVGCAAAVTALSCAASDEPTFETDPATTTSSGGSGGAGTGGSATGGNTGACTIDCSTIGTPQCQVSQCNEGTGQCEVVGDEDGVACDDGVFCTISDSCLAGTCTGGPQNDCGMTPPQCTEVSCDETSQTCSEAPAQNGDACQDPNNLCQKGATCSNGLCIGGTPDDCFFSPVPSDCHIAVCDPMDGMCNAEIGNLNGPCVDPNDLCTVTKTCDSVGMCVGGAPKDCSQLTQGCFDGKCDVVNGQCFADPIMPGQNCAEATDACNQGICDTMGICNATPINESQMCSDGLSCTSGTVCTSGVCGGGTSNVTIYFAEDFGSNAAGWTMDGEWQIGGAQTSSGHIYGNADPASDHTLANQNNGIAGVVIGGNANVTATHPQQYLTSPVVNTQGASSLHFEYWRWLNSDYTPFMLNVVEVFNGTSWIQLWASGTSPGVQDAAWTQQTFDITAHANSQLRVRFGFDVGSTGAFDVSQWNVDDVLIASGPCI
jgi:hypothetical protein